MASEFYTLIIVPHAKARFRKVMVSQRLVTWVGAMAMLVPPVVVLAAFQLGYSRARPSRPDVERIAASLRTSTDQMQDRMREAAVATQALLDAAKAQEVELAALQDRYQQLRALTAGQEELAATYGKILRETSLWERTRDVGVGWLLGTLSSLTAAFLVSLWRRSKEFEGSPPEPLVGKGAEEEGR